MVYCIMNFQNKQPMQVPMTDESSMPFGKFKGKKMANVPAGYLLWLHENVQLRDPLKTYITENLDVIKAEVKQKNNSKKD